MFDLLDALIASGRVASFARLSQSDQFQRKWPSIYDAVEAGKVDSLWLRSYLAQQVPQQGICVFPIDGSPWPRPRSKVLDDRQFVYQATSDVNGGSITIGYPYSMLEWGAEPHSSWSLPIDIRRVPSSQTAQEIGAEQINALAQVRASCAEALDIVAADGKYGNAGFLRSVWDCGAGSLPACAAIGCFSMPLRRKQENEAVPESMENALPSKNPTPGVLPLR